MRKFSKSMRRVMTTTLLCTLLTVCICPLFAQAAEERTVDIPIFTQTQILDLPRNSSSFWFNIPENTIIGEDSYFDLHITVSDTLINERSSITFSVNGTNLETIHILDIVDSMDGWWRVSIPENVLIKGNTNELKITTAQRSIEGDCADIDNPSNWVNLNEDSYLHLSVAEERLPFLQSIYSFFFDDIESRDELSSEFVIKNMESDTNIESVFKTASAIGNEYMYKADLSVAVADKVSNNADIRKKFYIGVLSQWTNPEFVMPESVEPGKGYLMIQSASQNNAPYRMIIGGGDDAGLQKATNFFADTQYLGQIDGYSLEVTSDISNNKKESEVKKEGYYTLTDFGYGDTSLAGAFHQTVTYTLPQPDGLESGDLSYVEIYFTHSKALVADNSLMTVYINDMPEGSVKLSSSNADDGVIKVKIPKEALERDTISLRIECYNYLGKVDCSKDYYDTAWTVIKKESVVYFEPGDEGIKPTLSSFPVFNAFSADDQTEITFGVPKDYTVDTLSLAATLAMRAGQNSGLVFDYTLNTDGIIGEGDKDNNMIFVGTRKNLILPAEISQSLQISINDKGNYMIQNNLPVSTETLKNKTILQVIRSPWNYHKRIYVLLYPEGYEKNIAEFFSVGENNVLLQDHIALIDTNGKVSTFALSDSEKDAEIPLTKERAIYIVEKSTGLPLWAIISMLVLVLVIIIFMINAIRDKTRFIAVEKKMREINADRIAEVGRPVEDYDDHSEDENAPQYGDDSEE